MNRRTIRVLLADDDVIAREGWKRILEPVGDIEVVGEVKTAQSALAEVKQLRPDVVLMDLKWYDNASAGWSAIAQIERESPQTKVIAVTAYPDLIPEARRAGAVAALTKSFSINQLVDTIRAVYELERFPVPAAIAEVVEELTERETEVLDLMAQGLTDKAIARKLNIAQSTAKNHVSNILGKLGAANRTEAVSIGYQKGILKQR